MIFFLLALNAIDSPDHSEAYDNDENVLGNGNNNLKMDYPEDNSIIMES